jgi:hypothetical protein
MTPVSFRWIVPLKLGKAKKQESENVPHVQHITVDAESRSTLGSQKGVEIGTALAVHTLLFLIKVPLYDIYLENIHLSVSFVAKQIQVATIYMYTVAYRGWWEPDLVGLVE